MALLACRSGYAKRNVLFAPFVVKANQRYIKEHPLDFYPGYLRLAADARVLFVPTQGLFH